MEKEWSENDLKEIAGQLGNPAGEGGVKMGNIMNRSNMGMSSRSGILYFKYLIHFNVPYL